MDVNTECAAYFKQNPGYQRIMSALCKKYKSLGHVGGNILIPNTTPAELDAMRALFGKGFTTPLKVSLSDFEEALQRTRYRGVTLPSLLSAYYGAPIQTKAEIHLQKQSVYKQTFVQVRQTRRSALCRRWLTALEERRTSGTALVRQTMEAGNAVIVLSQICESVEWLEDHREEAVRLAVLSAAVTSDPHALDQATIAGKLLLHLLAFCAEKQVPGTAEQRDALYFESGILCDSISSAVTQTGLVLTVDGVKHPAYEAFRLRHEVSTLTLTSLAALTGALSPSGRVYLVENEMVFCQLCDHIEEFHSPLICTSGQVNVAVLRLLDLLAASGATLLYSGDLDVGGLSIAARLLARYPQCLQLWRMAPEDYPLCRSQVPLDVSRMQGLDIYREGALAPIARALQDSGYAGYQELLIPQLQRDLTLISPI